MCLYVSCSSLTLVLVLSRPSIGSVYVSAFPDPFLRSLATNFLKLFKLLVLSPTASSCFSKELDRSLKMSKISASSLLAKDSDSSSMVGSLRMSFREVSKVFCFANWRPGLTNASTFRK